jgi:mannose-6-phosphate isomerase-like protein (cupin superfamily)
MPHTRSNFSGFWLSLFVAGTLTSLFVIGATAASAACPPGKETTDGQKPGATAHKGGEVAWHSHEDRPALIYVISGTITEYSSHCSVPIQHDAGDLSIEQAGLSHWWKNTTKKPVTLISADIAKDPNEKGM